MVLTTSKIQTFNLCYKLYIFEDYVYFFITFVVLIKLLRTVKNSQFFTKYFIRGIKAHGMQLFKTNMT